jgi:hypothetical protein
MLVKNFHSTWQSCLEVPFPRDSFLSLQLFIKPNPSIFMSCLPYSKGDVSMEDASKELSFLTAGGF